MAGERRGDRVSISVEGKGWKDDTQQDRRVVLEVGTAAAHLSLRGDTGSRARERSKMLKTTLGDFIIKMMLSHKDINQMNGKKDNGKKTVA